MLDNVGNVCEQFKKKKNEKVPVDVLCSILTFVLIVKNSLPNKTPIMLESMFAQFEQGLLDTCKIC